jgi:hypothetical protein
MEETQMLNAHRYICGALFTISLAVPATLLATPAPQEVKAEVRIYDSEHKDYHNWDEREERAWGRFLDENHRKRHEFANAEKKEQAEYWKWRHTHPD